MTLRASRAGRYARVLPDLRILPSATVGAL